MKRNKKIFIVTSILLAITAIIVFIIVSSKGEVVLSLSPDIAQLKINDNKDESVKNGQTISLSPGVHLFQFSRDGFANQTSRVTLTKGETINVTIALIPQTEAARKLVNSNPETSSITKQALDQKNIKLLARLPITTSSFSIAPCKSIKNPSDTTNKAVCITALVSDAENAALLYARNAGYNQKEFEILIGSKDRKTVSSTSDYKIEYYSNIDSSKTPLFVTLTGSEADQTKLLSIKDKLLSDLTRQGYDTSNYDIYYIDRFLSQFNPEPTDHDSHSLSPGE